jgi:hypothetical protein
VSEPLPPLPGAPRSRPTRLILFAILTLLCIGGIAIMDFSSRWGMRYWLITAAVFAATSVALARLRSRQDPSHDAQLKRQILHWSVIVVALLMVFLLEGGEHIDSSTGALTALLLVAVGTLLAGVHFYWQLGLLGLMLLATFAAAVMADQFFWIMLIPAVVLTVALFLRHDRDVR